MSNRPMSECSLCNHWYPTRAVHICFHHPSATIGGPRLEEMNEGKYWPAKLVFNQDEMADVIDANLEFEFNPDLVPRFK